MISRPLCARIDADCAPGRKPREPAFHLLFQSGERECAGTPDLISGQPELKAGREEGHCFLTTLSALG